MNSKELLLALQQLVTENGFKSQEVAIEWTNKVSPLLNKLSNKNYYEVFSNYAPYFCLLLSADLQSSAYNIMKSQLNSAIEELQLNIKEEEEMQGKHFPANSYLDIQKYVSRIFIRANNLIWICDPYLDQLIIEEIPLMKATQIKILTNHVNEVFKKRLTAAKKQLASKSIEVKLNQNIHDRYFILDKSEVWSIGTCIFLRKYLFHHKQQYLHLSNHLFDLFNILFFPKHNYWEK